MLQNDPKKGASARAFQDEIGTELAG